MTERVFSTPEKIGEQVAFEICALLAQKPDALVCIAAGHSSLPVFEALLAKKPAGADFSSMRFVAMDEWLGMNRNDPGSCGDFLHKSFLDSMEMKADRLRLFDGRADSPCEECASVEAFIRAAGGIDYILLGAGMNGHLALNEPGCDAAAGARVVELSEATKSVGQKYFDQQASLVGGLTLGMKNILEAGEIVLTIHGAHKREVIAQLRENPPSAAYPASLLHHASNAKLYIDEASIPL